MSTYPFHWTTGVRSLRHDLYAALDLAASVGEQVGIVDAQVAALKAGQDVTFTTAQLRSFYPNGTEHPSLPPDLTVATAWTLTGDDVLGPA
jgi:hypothetical protein